MTDRFQDGNTANNDQGHGEYGPKDGNLYSGGDLEVESIQVGFTVGEIDRPFNARIFPRNMVAEP